jgi:hypothetical protein
MTDRLTPWTRAVCIAAIAIAAAAGPAAAQATAGDASAQPATKLTDNLNIFMGLDGSKQPQDLGINANMGARFGVNWGFPISRSDNLGGQVGVAVNLSDAAVHVLDQVEGTSRRTQIFATGGVFQRTPNKLTWAAGFDVQFSDYYDTFLVGQIRGQIGAALSERHEMGAWVTLGVLGADAQVGATNIRLEPIGQINGYSSHTWPSNARTALWVGLAAGHDNIVLGVSEEPRSDWVVAYGAALQMPLSDRFAVAGAANFLTPTATGTVDAFLGVVFYPGGGLMKGFTGMFRPVLPLASNPMMPINMKFPD